MVPSGSSRRTSMRESVGSPAKAERERSRAAVVVAVLRMKSRRPIIYFLSSLGELAHAGRTYDIQFWTARKRFRWSNFEKQQGDSMKSTSRRQFLKLAGTSGLIAAGPMVTRSTAWELPRAQVKITPPLSLFRYGQVELLDGRLRQQFEG